jgi:uncharacterized protein involved in oxidation of intracellular sulfur
MNALFILNDAPYSSEKTYNALRLAMALQKDDSGAGVFLMADAVTAALAGQTTPQGYSNIERMVQSALTKGGQVRLCGSCYQAQGLQGVPLVAGAEVSTMDALAEWTVRAEKVLVF